MIIGLLLIGSFCGFFTAAVLLILGQAFWLAALAYAGVGAFVTLAIPMACLYRPRQHRKPTSRDRVRFLTDN